MNIKGSNTLEIIFDKENVFRYLQRTKIISLGDLIDDWDFSDFIFQGTDNKIVKLICTKHIIYQQDKLTYDLVEIGKAVRSLRKKRKITQIKLGEIAGVEGADVSRLEGGKFQRKKIKGFESFLKKIFISLGTTLEEQIAILEFTNSGK